MADDVHSLTCREEVREEGIALQRICAAVQARLAVALARCEVGAAQQRLANAEAYVSRMSIEDPKTAATLDALANVLNDVKAEDEVLQMAKAADPPEAEWMHNDVKSSNSTAPKPPEGMRSPETLGGTTSPLKPYAPTGSEAVQLLNGVKDEDAVLLMAKPANPPEAEWVHDDETSLNSMGVRITTYGKQQHMTKSMLRRARRRQRQHEFEPKQLLEQELEPDGCFAEKLSEAPLPPPNESEEACVALGMQELEPLKELERVLESDGGSFEKLDDAPLPQPKESEEAGAALGKQELVPQHELERVPESDGGSFEKLVDTPVPQPEESEEAEVALSKQVLEPQHELERAPESDGGSFEKRVDTPVPQPEEREKADDLLAWYMTTDDSEMVLGQALEPDPKLEDRESSCIELMEVLEAASLCSLAADIRRNMACPESCVHTMDRAIRILSALQGEVQAVESCEPP